MQWGRIVGQIVKRSREPTIYSTEIYMSKHLNIVTIGLLWHSFSSDNLGVGALSLSQVAICESAARNVGVRVRFFVFGTKGSQSYIPTNSEIVHYSLESFRELVNGTSDVSRALDKCDLVLDIGEGDSFADIYSARRFKMQIVSKMAVLWKGKPLVLSPQTIGPFNSKLNRKLAGWVINRCVKTYARDHISFEYLRTSGISPERVAEAIDVAFQLPFKEQPRAPDGKFKLGVNVSGLLYSGGYKNGNDFGLKIDYRQLVEKLLGAFVERDDFEVILVPHVLAEDLPRDDDCRAIAELANIFPKAIVAPRFASPSEAKGYIASLDFLTGARMHACIAAFSAGVPVVPIAYSRKFNGLFDSLNYQWYVDGKSMSTDEAFSKIVDALTHIDQLKNDLNKGRAIVSDRLSLYLKFLSELIESASQKGGQKC